MNIGLRDLPDGETFNDLNHRRAQKKAMRDGIRNAVGSIIWHRFRNDLSPQVHETSFWKNMKFSQGVIAKRLKYGNLLLNEVAVTLISHGGQWADLDPLPRKEHLRIAGFSAVLNACFLESDCIHETRPEIADEILCGLLAANIHSRQQVENHVLLETAKRTLRDYREHIPFESMRPQDDHYPIERLEIRPELQDIEMIEHMFDPIWEHLLAVEPLWRTISQ